MVDVVVNQLDTNAGFVILLHWLVEDGAAVSKGQPICEVETSKAVMEVSSPADGFLVQMAAMGEELNAGAIAGRIRGNDETVDKKNQTAVTAADNKGADRISFKARELMVAHNVSIDELPSVGFITVADVEKCFAARIEKRNALSGGIFKRLGKLSLEGLTLPSGCGDISEGKLDQEFLKRLQRPDEQERFRSLTSNEKTSLLQEHGAFIGENVSIGDGTLVYAPQIVIRDGVSIGAGGTIFCQERFIAGLLARFGSGLTLRCQQAVVGAGVYAEDKIIIGGGGHRDPWAVIAIGDDSYLGSELMLNTCRPILIGRNVFVTNRSTLLTHNVGHSYIDGHENRFAPVVLEDACQVGINSVVYAGSRIGSNAVVGSNSYVIGSIPAGKMAMGVPARVTGEAQQTLTLKKKQDRAREMLADLRELLECKGYAVGSFAEEERDLVVTYDGEKYGLALRPGDDCSDLPADVKWIVWTMDAPPVERQDGVVRMDLMNKIVSGVGPAVWVGSVREYLRRRGLKFAPSPWRYSGGLV